MSDELERAHEVLRHYSEHALQTAAAIGMIGHRRALLEAIRSLKQAGLHEQAEHLEQQLNAEPVRLALPQPSVNGVPHSPPALPAPPAKRRGRPPKSPVEPSPESGPSPE